MKVRKYKPHEKWEILLEALGSAHGPEEVCFRHGITMQELRRWLGSAREGALERLAGGGLAPPPPVLGEALGDVEVHEPTLLETPVITETGGEPLAEVVRPTEPLPSESTVEEVMPMLARGVGLSPERLDALFSLLTHELKEPLRGIRALCQFIDEDYREQLPDKAQQYLTMMAESAHRMQLLVDGLAEFARVLRGFNPEPGVELKGLLEKLRFGLQSTLQKRGATLVIDSRLPAVTGDINCLTLAFRHLIQNGIKFNAHAAPRVEVVLDEGDVAGQVGILIRDNGFGIEPRKADQAFELFQRLQRYEEYPGAGVGLAVARKVFEAHGGNLVLASTSSQGSVFRVSLPMPSLA